MSEKLNAAIEVLLEKLEEQSRGIIETKKMVNSLRQMMGQSPQFTDAELQQSLGNVGSLRADLFYGKGPTTAARMYLEMRNRACPADEIMNGLEQGGFDFEAQGWKKLDRLRSLSISLAKNSSIFHRLPNGTFGLLVWYPDIEKRSSKPDAEKENGNEEPKQAGKEK